MHSVGFIGLSNVGGKLAGSLLRNKCDVMVRDLDRDLAAPFLEAGAKWADSPKAMAEACEIIITCLPSPAGSAAVMEADDGVLAGLSAGKIWAEMTDNEPEEPGYEVIPKSQAIDQSVIDRFRVPNKDKLQDRLKSANKAAPGLRWCRGLACRHYHC